MKYFRLDLPLQSGRPRGAVLAAGVALVGLMLGYCAMLWPEWRQNPDLSHGFFAPLVFALLAWESRRLGPLRWLQPTAATRTFQVALAAGAVAVFAFTGLFAASLGWSHALVLFLLGVCLACLLLGGLTLFADERVRVLPFNWVNLTAILLWVLVAPLPTGTYARLTFGLQASVTTGVMEILQFFGVPARQHGNVIELAHVTVGIADACSGVRSLISCVYAGFFFAAWQVRRPLRRLVLIIVAPLLALGMNFIRSLILTLLANRGVDISGTLHDVTGFSILGLTARSSPPAPCGLRPRTRHPRPHPCHPPDRPRPSGRWPRSGSGRSWCSPSPVSFLPTPARARARPRPCRHSRKLFPPPRPAGKCARRTISTNSPAFCRPPICCNGAT